MDLAEKEQEQKVVRNQREKLQQKETPLEMTMFKITNRLFVLMSTI